MLRSQAPVLGKSPLVAGMPGYGKDLGETIRHRSDLDTFVGATSHVLSHRLRRDKFHLRIESTDRLQILCHESRRGKGHED